MMSSARFALSTTLLLTALTVLTTTGCKEEETTLFDEKGVWALESYSLMASGFTQIDSIRKNTFLLRFSPDDGVVAAANCYADGSSTSVNSATCTLATNDAEWECRCFAYEFSNSTMVWQEFTPGDTPPPVGSPDASGDTMGGEGDMGEGSGAHELTVEATEASGTFQYTSLPTDLFDSDGMISKHVFRIKADTVWTAADIDKDEVSDLDQCSMDCFPSMR